MLKTKKPSFAFIGWNPFQFLHIQEIARNLENSFFVIEKRKNHIYSFNDSFLKNSGTPFIVWNPNSIKNLDGIFDVIVCQTPFSQIEHFHKSKIAMIQYGYAKEVHNYGPWRSFADLCLVYGEYAKRKIEPYCPTVAIGNPRYDKWLNTNTKKALFDKYKSSLDSSKKTLLYVPTWGELSTSEKYFETILSLHKEYNILLKLHHNTDLLEKHKKKLVSQSNIKQFGANDDLLELLHISDIVLSDYSGAIFDAMFFNKHIILLHDDIFSKIGAKIDTDSLEYSQRESIGPIVENPSLLQEAISNIRDWHILNHENYERLRMDLFVFDDNATSRAVDALINLSRGQYRKDQIQSYIHNEIRNNFIMKRKLKKK